jgi:hypothetical protein
MRGQTLGRPDDQAGQEPVQGLRMSGQDPHGVAVQPTLAFGLKYALEAVPAVLTRPRKAASASW